ncbi:hypothetical protein [Streptomyces xanthochromogenes]|uniref:hypothetical protein n=1 Tax=Streptomyces xanthochromogenes TaxID=67384 RepID=UPI002F415C72
MSTYTRTPLRAAITVAALAGALLTPAAAFAATSTAAPATASAAEPCHVTKTVPSELPGMTVVLSDDASKGPKAELTDASGKVVATIDRAHPMDYAHGIRLEEGSGGKATFSQRTQTGNKAWKSQPFPALPASCLVAGTYTLVDGEKLNVVRLSKGFYRAETVSNGKPVKVIETFGQDADGFFRGMHVVLNAATGRLTSEFIEGRSGCTVTRVIDSVYPDVSSVKLTNGPAGPKAVLRDGAFKPIVTVDRAHPVNGDMGIRIDGADTATPRLGQRTQGGVPFVYTAFPKLPAGCGASKAATTPAKPAVNTAAQTTVVPKGAVAAGAEFKQGGSDKGALIVGGAAVAAAGGLGFVVVRRRSAARI